MAASVQLALRLVRRARTLDLAESTVKIHVQNVLKKLKLSSRVPAAVFAVEHGMLGGAR